MDFLAPAYPWVKAFHLMAVMAWMAGLFYLPRLYVYHCDIPRGGGVEHERFKTMERRLLRAIMNPSMIVTWLLGVVLMLTPGVVSWTSGWWHVKLLAVLLMTAFHMMLARHRRLFEADERRLSHRAWRMWNEVPTVLMIVIVIMVIVKPF